MTETDVRLGSGNSYQVIGAHLNGVQLKGPAEANGFNVDTSLSTFTSNLPALLVILDFV